MVAWLIPDDDSGRILTFDVIENENHENVVEISDHPVEQGVNVSDHVRPLPARLSLIGYTTNTPIRINQQTQRGEVRSIKLNIPQWEFPSEPTPGSAFRTAAAALDVFSVPDEVKATMLVFPEPFDAIAETHELLLELQSNGVLHEVITPLRVYEDMAITRVSAPRSAGDAGVPFGVDMRELRVIQSGQVTSPPVPVDDVPGGKPLENKGGQGVKPPTGDQAKPDSIAHQFLAGQGLSVAEILN